MLRVKDILNELNSADKKTEFWVLTSGYNFTEENATLLKTAGLKGVVISVDHFDPYRHNVFRGNMNSFKWVEDAVKNASAANLVIAFSICVTREFVSMQNLFAYASLAKNMGAAFIQILEPKPVGHYKDKNVLLEQSQLEVLEAFFWQMNYSGKYTDFPLVNYHGYYQRSTGCFAAGNRNLYVDTDGDLHACPFCHKKTGNVLSSDLAESICKLEKEGCMSFSVADY